MSSYGQSILRDYLDLMMPSGYLENHRPDWLLGLELDFFYPKFGIGIEFQGDQHFSPITGFHNLHSQKIRDRDKKALCRRNGVRLAEVNVRTLQYGPLLTILNEAIRLTGNRAMLHWLEECEWRPLDRRVQQYRLQLRRSFDSPSAAWNKKMRQRANRRAEKRANTLLTARVAM